MIALKAKEISKRFKLVAALSGADILISFLALTNVKLKVY